MEGIFLHENHIIIAQKRQSLTLLPYTAVGMTLHTVTLTQGALPGPVKKPSAPPSTMTACLCSNRALLSPLRLGAIPTPPRPQIILNRRSE